MKVQLDRDIAGKYYNLRTAIAVMDILPLLLRVVVLLPWEDRRRPGRPKQQLTRKGAILPSKKQFI